jgi:hypothetical protein
MQGSGHLARQQYMGTCNSSMQQQHATAAAALLTVSFGPASEDIKSAPTTQQTDAKQAGHID